MLHLERGLRPIAINALTNRDGVTHELTIKNVFKNLHFLSSPPKKDLNLIRYFLLIDQDWDFSWEPKSGTQILLTFIGSA